MSRPYSEHAAGAYEGVERWVLQYRVEGWPTWAPPDLEDRLLEVMDLCWRWMSDEERAAANARAAAAVKVTP